MLAFFDVSGAELLSFLQPVTEIMGRREDGGEVIAPVILLVHICPEVAELRETFPSEAALRERSFRGVGGVEIRVGKVLDGLEEIDQGWRVSSENLY